MSTDIMCARFKASRAGGGSLSPHETEQRNDKARERPTAKALVMHEALLSSVYISRLPPPPLPLNYTRVGRKPQRGTTALSVLILFPRAIFRSPYLSQLA